jgi:hypothetical protein
MQGRKHVLEPDRQAIQTNFFGFRVVLAVCAHSTKLSLLLIFKIKLMSTDKIPNGIFVHVNIKKLMVEKEIKFWVGKRH